MNEHALETDRYASFEIERLRSLIAVISCVSIAGISMGFTLPLMTISLDRGGSSSSFIGLIGSMLGIAIVLYSPLVPACISYMGMKKYVLLCMVTEAFMFICLKLFPAPYAWIVIRLIMGMAVAGIFIATESWINHLAKPAYRGRILALFNISLGLGFAAGPLLLIATGTESWTPFLAGFAITSFAVLPLLFVKNPRMNLEKSSSFNYFSFILIAPAFCAAVVLVSGTETLMGTFFHYYSTRLDYPLDTIHVMLTLFFIGGIVFQYPIGWLADHMDIRYLLLILGIICSICILLIFKISETPFFLKLMLFCWGGIVSSIYNTVLTAVGQQYKDADLITANTSFGFLWGLGGLVPLLGGKSTEIFGENALLYTSLGLTLFFVFLMVFAIRNPTTRGKTYP